MDNPQFLYRSTKQGIPHISLCETLELAMQQAFEDAKIDYNSPEAINRLLLGLGRTKTYNREDMFKYWQEHFSSPKIPGLKGKLVYEGYLWVDMRDGEMYITKKQYPYDKAPKNEPSLDLWEVDSDKRVRITVEYLD